jgi:hypothetical protein
MVALDTVIKSSKSTVVPEAITIWSIAVGAVTVPQVAGSLKFPDCTDVKVVCACKLIPVKNIIVTVKILWRNCFFVIKVFNPLIAEFKLFLSV